MAAEEDRALFESGVEPVTLVIASGAGVVAADVAGDRIGGFRIVDRSEARAVTVFDDEIAVATATDVLVGEVETLEPTDFGAATTVGASDGLLAATPDGRVARYVDDAWTELGAVAEVRAIEDGFLATADGVHRCEAGLPHVGLTDVYDVATRPVPRAGTGTGLYRLGNGWVPEHDGVVTTVAEAGERLPVHAILDDAIHRVTTEGCTRVTTPVTDRLVDVTVESAVYAVTERGTLVVDAGTGWRTHPLGVDDVGGLAVVSK